MKRIGAVSVVALVLVAAVVVAGIRLLTPSDPTHIQAVFSSTVGLYKGSDVQVLGVKVGEVTSVEPQGADVLVGLDIDSDQHVAPGTGAVVIAPSLVSDRFVQLTQPWVSGATMTDGTTIPESRTQVPVELDQLYGSLDTLSNDLGPEGANKDGAVSDLLTTAAANLDGNGADLNKLISRFSAATTTLSSSDGDLFTTVKNLDDFSQVLVQNDTAVGQVNTQLATVSQYLADDRGDLAKAISTLGASLTQVTKFIRDNRGHLRSSLKKLTGTTEVLQKQKDSLKEVIRTLPAALTSFLGAYNPDTGSLNVRADINELSIWSKSGAGAGQAGSGAASSGAVSSGSASSGSQKSGAGTSGTTQSGSTAQDPPPLLLPSVGDR